MHKNNTDKTWPKLSIITPNYNQGEYIEDTIRSVLLQGYPNLEYIIIDGGSTDKSIEIIKKYEKKLSYWCSEKDLGMYDALNKGFSFATGDIMAWINSDDMYTPWAFNIVVDVFSTISKIEWLTSLFPINWNLNGIATGCKQIDGFNRRAFLRGRNLPRINRFETNCIQQESTFWRKTLWKKAGSYIDRSFIAAGDFELWARFFDHSELYSVKTPIGGFRTHKGQISEIYSQQYYEEAIRILKSKGGKCYCFCENWIRHYVLKKVPKSIVKHFRGLAYPAKVVSYNHRKKTWKVNAEYFV